MRCLMTTSSFGNLLKWRIGLIVKVFIWNWTRLVRMSIYLVSHIYLSPLSINWTHHVITCYTNDNVLFQTDDIVQTCQMSHLLVVTWRQEQPRQATWCFGRITPPLATPSITNITRTMVFSISEQWVIVMKWFRHPFVGEMVSCLVYHLYLMGCP